MEGVAQVFNKPNQHQRVQNRSSEDAPWYLLDMELGYFARILTNCEHPLREDNAYSALSKDCVIYTIEDLSQIKIQSPILWLF